MKRATLALLCCPLCHGELSLRPEPGIGPVEEGHLLCSRCEGRFPITRGIPRFIRHEELDGLNRRFAGYYDWFSYLYTFFTKVAFLPMGGERKARQEVLDRLDLNGGRVLEVSVGPGSNLPYLFQSPAVGDVCGLDISRGQLDRCQSLVRRRGWGVDLFLGTAEALPFKEGCFGTVFHIGGINFFSDKKQAIQEMIRVARPGTKIVIADEAERLARLYDRLPGSRPHKGQEADIAVSIHLVPDAMQDVRVDGIWKVHGQPHGYCLEFRKPG